MNRILLLHPEGNINNNPNLTGIVEILCEQGYTVDIFSKKNEKIYQFTPCPNAHLYLEEIKNFEKLLELTIKKYCAPYSLIIGVDQDGIIEASKIAGMQNVPYGLISYEILFEDEIGLENKKDEIEACKKLSFAVVSDKIRGALLSKENKIPKDKLLYIPVAGRAVRKDKKLSFLHTKFKIENNKHIALYMGSILQWAMIDELIESIDKWPDDWVLVIHGRYGQNYLNKNFVEKVEKSKKIFFSSEPCEKFNDLSILLHSADAGIAFYKPCYTCSLDGNNIKNIGLSSGKLAVYLQHGLPVITNATEPWTSYIKTYNLGMVIKEPRDIENCFNQNITREDFKENCYRFFYEYLDLDKTIIPLLDAIKRFNNKNSNTPDYRGLVSSLKKIFFAELLNQENEIRNAFIQKAEKSLFHRIKNRLLKVYGITPPNLIM